MAFVKEMSGCSNSYMIKNDTSFSNRKLISQSTFHATPLVSSSMGSSPTHVKEIIALHLSDADKAHNITSDPHYKSSHSQVASPTEVFDPELVAKPPAAFPLRAKSSYRRLCSDAKPTRNSPLFSVVEYKALRAKSHVPIPVKSIEERGIIISHSTFDIQNKANTQKPKDNSNVQAKSRGRSVLVNKPPINKAKSSKVLKHTCNNSTSARTLSSSSKSKKKDSPNSTTCPATSTHQKQAKATISIQSRKSNVKSSSKPLRRSSRTLPKLTKKTEESTRHEVARIDDLTYVQGVAFYTVHWVGYTDPTNEPWENLDGCSEALHEYHARSNKAMPQEVIDMLNSV